MDLTRKRIELADISTLFRANEKSEQGGSPASNTKQPNAPPETAAPAFTIVGVFRDA
jgi:hypothetical protein